MGYCVRALMGPWEDGPPSDLLAFSREDGHELRLERAAETAVDHQAWREADLLGPDAAGLIEVEVALDAGTAECLVC